MTCRSSCPELFLRKNVLKIYSKFTAEHPCRRAISIKELCNFIEIAVWHRCSPVNLLHNFRIHFPKNRSAGYFWKRIVFWIRSFENWFLAGNNLMPVCSNKNFRIIKITTKVKLFLLPKITCNNFFVVLNMFIKSHQANIYLLMSTLEKVVKCV